MATGLTGFFIATCAPTSSNVDCGGVNNTCNINGRQTKYLYAPLTDSLQNVDISLVTLDETGLNSEYAQFQVVYSDPNNIANCIIKVVNGEDAYYISAQSLGSTLQATTITSTNSTWAIGFANGNIVDYYSESSFPRNSPTTGFVHLQGNENQWWLNYNKGSGPISSNAFFDNISSNKDTNPITTDGGKAQCNYTFRFIPISTTSTLYNIPAQSGVIGSNTLSTKLTRDIDNTIQFYDMEFYNSDCYSNGSCSPKQVIANIKTRRVKSNIPGTKKYKVLQLKGEQFLGLQHQSSTNHRSHNKKYQHTDNVFSSKNKYIYVTTIEDNFFLVKISTLYLLITDKVNISCSETNRIIKDVRKNHNIKIYAK